MAVDPVLTLVAIARLVETNWRAMKYQEWFPYSYDAGKNMVLPAGPPLVRRSAGVAEVREGGRPEVRQRY